MTDANSQSRRISIVGFGLLGSSIARAVRERAKDTYEIQAIDNSQEHLNAAQDLNLADAYDMGLENVWPDADYVAVCTPVRVIPKVAIELLQTVNKGTIVFDTGSVKGSVVREVSQAMADCPNFVPAHPMAGSHLTGPENGIGDLLVERKVVLTPFAKDQDEAAGKVSAFFQELGANVVTMTAERHDQVVSYTSHLPHLLAFSFMLMNKRFNTEDSHYVKELAAGSFRDFTRIAGADAIMWRDIFLENSDHLLQDLEDFEALIAEWRTSLQDKQTDSLFSLIGEANKAKLDMEVPK